MEKNKATSIVIQIWHPPKLAEQMSPGTKLAGCGLLIPPVSCSFHFNLLFWAELDKPFLSWQLWVSLVGLTALGPHHGGY